MPIQSDLVVFHKLPTLLSILLWSNMASSSPTRTNTNPLKHVYNLADETPAGSLIGNVAENMSTESVNKFTFLLMPSSKFQYLSDYFMVANNGDLTSLRYIDRDNPNICGPLGCCKLVVCEIQASVILSRIQEAAAGTRSSSSSSSSGARNIVNKKSDFGNYNDHGLSQTTDPGQIVLQLVIRIHDANDNAPQFGPISTTLDDRVQGTQTPARPFAIYMREGDLLSLESTPLALDADSQPNGIREYRLVEQTRTGDPVLKNPKINISVVSNLAGDVSNYHEGNLRTVSDLIPKLVQLKPLDYENVDDREIYATLYAIDGGDPRLTGSLSIVVHLLDVNDNSPQFGSLDPARYIDVPENTTMNHTSIYVANATDADSGDNGRLTYSISPLASTIVQKKFAIDSETGSLTIVEPLDYEIYSERQFVVPVVAKDSGSPQRSSTASIYISVQDVNDNVPSLIVQENITIPEGQVLTKPVLRFYIKDEDEASHGKVVCKPTPLNATHLKDPELVAGKNFLRLHSVSDTVFFVFTRGVLDFERTPRASLLIDCLDSATLGPGLTPNQPDPHHQIRITAAVQDHNDNSPEFGKPKYFAQLREHPQDGTLVVQVEAQDADTGNYGRIMYSLGQAVSESGHIFATARNQNAFHIDPSSGSIMVLHGSLLDREVAERIYVPIIAKDVGGHSSTADLVIELTDINDHPPQMISQSEFLLEENQRVDSLIGYIRYMDPDKGSNGRIHLMTSPNLGTQTNRYIKLVPDPRFNYSSSQLTSNIQNELVGDGEIQAMLVTQNPVDRETVATLFVELVAFDEGKPSNSVTHTISIQIMDQNDNAPVSTFPLLDTTLGYHPSIHTNSPLHTLVTQLRAHDPDQGPNGTVTFRLSPSTNGSDFFHLDPDDGKLSTNWNSNSNEGSTQTKLVRLEPSSGIYQIKVILSDRGTPPLIRDTQFYVRISPPDPRLDRLTAVESGATRMGFVQTVSKYWVGNRFLFVVLFLLTFIIITLVIATVFWAKIRKHQSKATHSIKDYMTGQMETNPIVPPTEESGTLIKHTTDTGSLNRKSSDMSLPSFLKPVQTSPYLYGYPTPNPDEVPFPGFNHHQTPNFLSGWDVGDTYNASSTLSNGTKNRNSASPSGHVNGLGPNSATLSRHFLANPMFVQQDLASGFGSASSKLPMLHHHQQQQSQHLPYCSSYAPVFDNFVKNQYSTPDHSVTNSCVSPMPSYQFQTPMVDVSNYQRQGEGSSEQSNPHHHDFESNSKSSQALAVELTSPWRSRV